MANDGREQNPRPARVAPPEEVCPGQQRSPENIHQQTVTVNDVLAHQAISLDIGCDAKMLDPRGNQDEGEHIGKQRRKDQRPERESRLGAFCSQAYREMA